MSQVWRTIITPSARGAWNMAVDEAILESAGRGDVPPTLRLYDWSPACLSLGYAQSFADVDLPALRANGWEVVRRVTGGRAILHVDELTYSVCAPADEPVVKGSVLESYQRLARALVRAVRSLGLPVEMEEKTTSAGGAAGPVCFEVPSAYEIVVAGRKLVGSAQARRKEGVLQHGTLPLHGDLTRITRALVFPDEPSRERAAQKLLAHATNAETVLGRIIPWQDAAGAFVNAFTEELGLEMQPGELTPTELARAAELQQSKYDHPEWTKRS